MSSSDRRNMIVGLATLCTVLLSVSALCYWLFRAAPPPLVTQPSDVSDANVARIARPQPPPDDYVGSQTCAECHQDVVDAYQSHPMAHSLAEVHKATPLESYDQDNEFQAAGPRQYSVEKNGEQVEHHEILSDEDGVIYDQSVEVQYALGSGIRGRSYLIKNDRMLSISPITWYSGKQRWDLSPGYHPQFHPRFSRVAGDGCLMCHAGRTASDRDHPDTYDTPPFLEHAIGCERCHGPAGRHVAHHRAVGDDRPADVIVNPADLKIPEREAVCNQCHLSGETRSLRYGRSNHDFRPGNRLEDIWTIFVRDDRSNTDHNTRVVSHVEQMRASRCYQASSGQLGCTSCHDPHRVPTEQEHAEFYKQRCFQCHNDQSCAAPVAVQNQAPASGSCVACHLPKLPANNVPHTTQTNHRIVRQSRSEEQPGLTLSGLSHIRSKLTLFDGAEKRLSKLVVDRARGLQLVEAAKKSREIKIARRIQSLLKPTLAQAPNDIIALNAMAVTFVLLDDHELAEASWTRALEFQPDNEAILTPLAIINHQRNDLEAALTLFDRAIAVNPSSTKMLGRRAHVLGQMGRTDEAIKSAERALESNPTVLQHYQWLAEAYQLQNNTERSRHFQRLHDRIEKAMKPKKAPETAVP